MVNQLFEELRRDLDRVVIEDDAYSLTARQFEEAVRRSAAFWDGFFPSKGHHVGILAENSVLWYVQMLGIIASGNVAVGYNFNLSNEDTAKLMELTDTEVMLCEECAENAMQSCGGKALFIPMRQAFAKQIGELTKRKPDEDIIILFSSGTMGRGNKAVRIINRNITCQCDDLRANRSEWESRLIPYPLYHISGIAVIYRYLMRGMRVVISSARAMLRDLKKYDVTAVCVFPAMAKLLFEYPEVLFYSDGTQKIRRLLNVGTSLGPQELRKIKEYHLEHEETYGMTEVAGAVTAAPYREGSSGWVQPYNEVRIQDGEILIRGDNVTPGYYRNEEDTRRLLQDGWLHTGDLGRVDEDGYLYVVGRKKNIIILSNGENVNPEELEAKLYGCPQVTECRVFGEQDSLCAEIYTEEDGTPLAEREQIIRAWSKELNGTLPSTHRLKRLEIRNTELEKTSTGKIKRK